jgi:hypothetical protein
VSRRRSPSRQAQRRRRWADNALDLPSPGRTVTHRAACLCFLVSLCSAFDYAITGSGSCR